uniref:[RNA-polymerase]-subunit kinase n=1 Tax=Hucho hucho TaxID=62062 RepID=A0A4W5KDF8_9TELE
MALDVKSRAKIYEKLDSLGEAHLDIIANQSIPYKLLIILLTITFTVKLCNVLKESTIIYVPTVTSMCVHHVSISQLLDVFGNKLNISLVFDFMETDLEVIINDTSLVLTPAKIKGFIVMTTGEILCEYDLKPNNLLLDENGLLRLSDFGLTKTLGRPTVYTHQVVTCRWCCSPELLFGARMYGVGVDMWAMGCILVELLQLPFLAGDSDTWPFSGTLEHIFSAAGDDLLERLQGLFTFNPSTRLTATQPLRVRYFTNRPGLIPGPQLPQHNSSAEPLKMENLQCGLTVVLDRAL